MTGAQIKEKFKILNQELKDAMTIATFVLNEDQVRITREINELRKQCPHSFVSGICEFCGKWETRRG